MDYNLKDLETIYNYEKNNFKTYKVEFKCTCGFTGTDVEVIEHVNKSEYPSLHGISDLLKNMWKASDVNIDKEILHSLVLENYLLSIVAINQITYYRISNIENFKELMDKYKKETENTETITVNNSEKNKKGVPDDLFNLIVGYDDLKELLLKIINKGLKVHVLLKGTPATGKSLFLYEIMRLSGCNYLLGGSTTKVGIEEYLMEEKPKYLIIDEIDKMQRKDFSVLLGLMEDGTVSIHKHRTRQTEHLDTIVFGACNKIEHIPDEIKSRFSVISLKPYQDDQLKDIIKNVLINREQKSKELAEYIASQCIKYNIRDVREAIRIARLSDTTEEVNKNIKILNNYK
jgi:hypothetical protein